MIAHNWLWIDLETTGLDARNGAILEVAAAVVDDGPDGTFEILDFCDTVITPDDQAAKYLDKMDPVVVDMHTKNGLLAELANGQGMPLAEADSMIADFIAASLPGGHKVVLAGGSVHFDLGWIRVHMPKLAALCHYRVFDVSTLKAAARVWGPGFEDIKGAEHRALADVSASIAEAKAYRDLVIGVPA